MTTANHGMRIGFIGAGRMAGALAHGLIQSQFVGSDRVFASDVSKESLKSFVEATQATPVAANADLAATSDVLVLAVKPQHMESVLRDLRDSVGSEQLVVSIAAGVTLSTLQDGLGESRRVIRVMPNTPCLVGCGASAFARGSSASDEDAQIVEAMLSTVGLALEVPESQLDAVTGLSGSGPAYVFQIIESLSDGGVRMGLPRDAATRLAAQTLLGAARMVLETGRHPGDLKDDVASPGGTTIAGLHALERGGLRAALMDAVEAATVRSQELGGS